MCNIKVKYKKISSSEGVENTITLPFLPLVGDDIILEDKTVIKVNKISHCVVQGIAILDCIDKTKAKLTKGFRMG